MKRTADAGQAAAVRFCDADRENSPPKAVVANQSRTPPCHCEVVRNDEGGVWEPATEGKKLSPRRCIGGGTMTEEKLRRIFR